MIGISSGAAEMLKENLVKICFDAGIGFRVLVADDERGETTFSIRIDRAREGDEVLEVDGLRVFSDPASATQFTDHELDYIDQPQGGFVLK